MDSTTEETNKAKQDRIKRNSEMWQYMPEDERNRVIQENMERIQKEIKDNNLWNEKDPRQLEEWVTNYRK